MNKPDNTTARPDEIALGHERNFVNTILDNAGALIVVLDREGRIRRFNRACEKLSQYSFAEAEGRYVWDFLLLPEEADAVREQAFRALADNPQSMRGAYTNHWLSRTGEKRLIDWTNTMLLDDQGKMEYMVSIGMDVTEQREIEAALKRSEETYARAEAITHIGSWDWNIVTNDLHWSDEIYRIFGQTPQAFGATYAAFLDAVYPDDRQKVIDAVNACVADANVVYSIEHRVVRPDGNVRVVHENGKVYRDESGAPIRMIGTVHDITGRKEAETEFSTILQTTADGYWMVSPQDGRLLDVNQAYCEMSGYTREELLSMRIHDLEAVETQEDTRRHIADVLEGRNARFDTVHRRKDGSLFHLEISAKFIQTRGGVIVAMLRDITARKQQEAELRRHREHLEELVEERAQMLQEAQRIAHLGNWKWDVASGVISWSEEIYRIFGYAPGEFEPTYERFMATVHPEDVERIKQSEQEAFAKGEHHSIDHRIVLPSGEIRWVHEEAVSNVGADGKPVSLTGTVQDITQRKQIEDALVKAKELAERANKGKSEFLSRMSHELRTPMNAILGFAQVLEIEPLTAEQQDFVTEISQAGHHLLELINELLDLSRIEAGRFNLVIKPVSLSIVSEQAIQLVTPLLQQKDIALRNKCGTDISLLADSTRLKQVLVNLLSNAAKYNRDGGSIRIECEQQGEMLRIKVSDSGIGIPAEKQPQLFTPFERLGAEFTAVDGTGIGLALSRHMVELMGGQIGVESQPGQGSTFWFDLPLAASVDVVEQMSDAAQWRIESRLKILYVEDNAANLKVVEAMLRREPEMTLMTATDGEYGLELAQRYQPDAILLDIHLPGMDGYAVLQALKSRAETAAIPVIALSADAMPLDIEKGLAAGFSDYLSKPVKATEIVEALNRLTANVVRPT